MNFTKMATFRFPKLRLEFEYANKLILIKIHQQIQFFINVESYNVQNVYRLILILMQNPQKLNGFLVSKNLNLRSTTCQTLSEITVLDLKSINLRPFNQDVS